MLGTCANNNGTTWTYNQGVILGALVELFLVTGDSSMLDHAIQIANATIKRLVSTPEGVLNEPQIVDTDQLQFKGVFIRHLRLLMDVVPAPLAAYYSAFIKKNIYYVLRSDLTYDGRFGGLWQGPVDPSADVEPPTSSEEASAADTKHVLLPWLECLEAELISKDQLLLSPEVNLLDPTPAVANRTTSISQCSVLDLLTSQRK